VGSVLFVPAVGRSEETWISNAVWKGLNSVTCGGLKRSELESPSFATEHQHQYQLANKVAADEDEADDVEKSAVDKVKAADPATESAPSS